MLKIILKTHKQLEQYLFEEVKSLLKKDLKNNSLTYKDKKDLVKDFKKLYFDSKTIDRIYLEKNKEKIDLCGFSLFERDYKINTQENQLPSFLVHILLKELEPKKGSFLDPLAHFGDLIIEASKEINNSSFHIKKRNSLPFNEFFETSLDIPKQNKSQNKFQAIVQDNVSFKKLKENLNYTKEKIKVSKIDFEFLDAKFREDDFDYTITYIDDKDFVDEILFQAAFITKKSIGIISHGKLDSKVLKKNDLILQKSKKITIDEIHYHISILKYSKQNL